MIKLFTTPTCANCPGIKKLLDEAGLKYETVDASRPEAREELFSHGVRAVPYLHATNAHGSDYKALGSGINITSLKEFLNVSS